MFPLVTVGAKVPVQEPCRGVPGTFFERTPNPGCLFSSNELKLRSENGLEKTEHEPNKRTTKLGSRQREDRGYVLRCGCRRTSALRFLPLEYFQWKRADPLPPPHTSCQPFWFFSDQLFAPLEDQQSSLDPFRLSTRCGDLVLSPSPPTTTAVEGVFAWPPKFCLRPRNEAHGLRDGSLIL